MTKIIALKYGIVLKYLILNGADPKNHMIEPAINEEKNETSNKNLQGYWKNAIRGITSHIGFEISSVKKTERRNPRIERKIILVWRFLNPECSLRARNDKKDSMHIDNKTVMMWSFPILNDNPSIHPFAEPPNLHGLSQSWLKQIKWSRKSAPPPIWEKTLVYCISKIAGNQ